MVSGRGCVAAECKTHTNWTCLVSVFSYFFSPRKLFMYVFCLFPQPSRLTQKEEKPDVMSTQNKRLRKIILSYAFQIFLKTTTKAVKTREPS